MNQPDFVFDLTVRWNRHSDQELLAALRRLGALLGNRAFTMQEFRNWPDRPCVPHTISLRFGSWRRAMAAAGFVGGFAGTYSVEELISNLESAWRKQGRPPSLATISKLGPISSSPYLRRWGSLRRACQALARYKRAEITRDQLLAGSASKSRRTLRPSLRWRILNRDCHRCVACGKSTGDPGVKLEVDHIIPIPAGGTDDPSNLRALCFDCNRGKGPRVSAA